MFYRRRASPKHRYNIIEEDYGGGGHRTRLIDLKDQLLLCLWGAPLPPYIKEQGGGAAGQEEARQGRVLLLPGVGLPPLSLVGLGLGGKEERDERKGGRRPPPCPIQTRGGGGVRPALAAPPLLHFRPMRPINPPGGSGNPPVLRFYPKLPRTFGVRI